ncbi:MAG: hypothetical protein AABW50_05835 [Nanoarchaeota archaeon]
MLDISPGYGATGASDVKTNKDLCMFYLELSPIKISCRIDGNNCPKEYSTNPNLCSKYKQRMEEISS